VAVVMKIAVFCSLCFAVWSTGWWRQCILL